MSLGDLIETVDDDANFNVKTIWVGLRVEITSQGVDNMSAAESGTRTFVVFPGYASRPQQSRIGVFFVFQHATLSVMLRHASEVFSVDYALATHSNRFD